MSKKKFKLKFKPINGIEPFQPNYEFGALTNYAILAFFITNAN